MLEKEIFEKIQKIIPESVD